MRYLRAGKWLSLLGIVAVLGLGVCARGATAQSNGAPLILPLEPGATKPGSDKFKLKVNGFGFAPGATVNWNGDPRETKFVSHSQVVAKIGEDDFRTAATVLVTVTNPGPNGGTSNAQFFEITKPTVGLAFQEMALASELPISRAVVGDFNGDGKQDIADLTRDPNSSQNAIELRFGNGNGTFQDPVTVLLLPTGFSVTGLASGDVNADGKMDLVGSFFSTAGGLASGTFALLGNGDGTFGAPLVSDPDGMTSVGTNEIVVADVNGDGVPDLVRALTHSVSVELGNGDGTFRNSFIYTPQVPPGANFSVKSVVLGDFRKDGKLDIVAGINYQNIAFRAFFLVSLPGNVDGTFGTANILYEGQSILDDLFVKDFDGDGNLDVAAYYLADQAAVLATGGALSVFFGNGDGTIQATPQTLNGLPEGGGVFDLGSQTGTSKLVAGDFNADRHMDLAVQNAVILIGNGTGPFSYSVLPTGASSSTYSTVAAGDFNGDGRLDLVGIDSSQKLFVLSQMPPPADFKGSLRPSTRTVVPGSAAVYRIAIEPIDGFDGAVELTATGLPPGATATFRPSVIQVEGRARLIVRTAADTATGSYPIVVTGTSGTITHTGGVTLNVGPEGTDFGDFTGTVNPGFDTIVPGQGSTFQIAVTPLNGFSSDVSLGVSGLPPGATATFHPSVITGGAGQASMTITTANPTPTATYPLLITGTGGGKTHTSGVNLNVGPPLTDFTDFTGSVTPQSQTVVAGQSASFFVSIQLLNGTGCVNVQVLGLPAGSSGNFDRGPQFCGKSGAAVFTLATTVNTVPGDYVIVFDGMSSGGKEHSQSAMLSIRATAE